MKISPSRSLLPLLFGVAAAGCATTQPLKTDSSTSAIRSAEELGATEQPQAALYLQLAQEELDAATALNAQGKPEEAKSLLLRAEADAEMAVALAHADSQRKEAQEAIERVRKLQSDNPYAPGGAQ